MIDQRTDNAGVAEDHPQFHVLRQPPVRQVRTAQQSGVPVGSDNLCVQYPCRAGSVPDPHIGSQAGEDRGGVGGLFQQKVDLHPAADRCGYFLDHVTRTVSGVGGDQE